MSLNNTDIKILKFVREQEQLKQTCEIKKITSRLNVTNSEVLKLSNLGYISSDYSDGDFATGYYLTSKGRNLIKY